MRSALLLLVAARPEADRVTSLPGWDGDLPSTWYSGFLDAGDGKKLHYVYVEAESSPESKPVTLWLNGGPGCSSLDGAFFEHGQLLLQRTEKGVALQRNPWAWTKVSSMMYMEAPAGVGFSYGGGSYASNDTATAAHNLQALHAFFALFPELKSREFYISGESYGGVYVPTLSQAIKNDPTVDWNMQGLLVGNGVMGWELMAQSRYPFLHGHGAISDAQYEALIKACSGAYGASQECAQMQQDLDSQAAGLNMYDFYRDCYAHAPGRGASLDFVALRRAPRPPHPAALPLTVQGPQNVPCIDTDAGNVWLNQADVKKALHVDASPNKWGLCSDAVSQSYQRNMQYAAAPILADLQTKYRVVLYHGDTDMACDYIQGQHAFTDAAEQEKLTQTSAWTPWTYTDDQGVQFGGWLEQFTSSKGVKEGLNFITIKGAGHMAPQWKPQASFEMFSRFLERRSLRDGSTPENVVVL